jgi:hypothetical protein
LSSLLLRRRKSVATGCHSRVNIDVLNYLLVKLSLFYYLARAHTSSSDFCKGSEQSTSTWIQSF